MGSRLLSMSWMIENMRAKGIIAEVMVTRGRGGPL
jgi:hypothetical protein